MANEKVKDTGNDEEISLSENEMENILGGAELSEVSLDLPSLDDVDENPSADESDTALSQSDESLNLDEEDITGDLPSLDDISLDEPSSTSGDDLILDEQIPEDLPSIDEMDSTDLPAKVKTLEEIDPAPLPETDFAEDLPSLDDMELPDLHEDTEIIDVSGKVPDELPTTKAAPVKSDMAMDEGGEDENETVSLSESEMSGILSEVDENQVIDLKAPVDEGDEVVSVSGEELDSITQDLDLVGEAETGSDESVDLGEAADAPGQPSEKDVMKDSVNFEAEIMEDAQVSFAKPKSSLVDLEDAVDKGMEELDRIEAGPAAPLAKSERKPDKFKKEEEDFSAPLTTNGLDREKLSAVRKKASGKIGNDPVVSDKELFELLSYLDELLDHLPEDKVREFAESKHYDRYISLINRLGI